MLTDADLIGMRDAVEASLPESAVIQTRSYHSDHGGGGTTTWTPSSTVACRLSPVSPTSFGAERAVAMRITEEADWLLTVPQATEITTDSRAVINAGTYEVLALHEPRSWELCRRAEVCEVT